MSTHLPKYEKSWKDGHAYFTLTSRFCLSFLIDFVWFFSYITFFMPRMTGSSITMDEARDYELSLSSTDNGERPTSTTNEADDENRVLTLAELKELIESGDMDKIPNNKIIPEKLNVSYSFLLFSIF